MNAAEELLADGLHEIGLDCTPDQRLLLLEHLHLVIEKNKELNLTRIDSLEDGIYLHIIDSLICAEQLKSLGNSLKILDLGTGGGFPGIPLSIVLGGHVTLLDSISKKVAAVDGFIKQLHLDSSCAAICSRSEDLARITPESFDVVLARAVAQTNVLIEYASPLLVAGGILCALKANVTDDEFEHASRSSEICGMSIVSRETIELPKGYGHREILYIEKTGAPSIQLPRRNGMATKRPLGM